MTDMGTPRKASPLPTEVGYLSDHPAILTSLLLIMEEIMIKDEIDRLVDEAHAIFNAPYF